MYNIGMISKLVNPTLCPLMLLTSTVAIVQEHTVRLDIQTSVWFWFRRLLWIFKVFQYASEQAHIASTNIYYYESTSTQEAEEERGTNGARASSVT